MKCKWVLVILFVFGILLCNKAQNTFPSHERVSKVNANNLLNDVILELYDVKGELQFVEKCEDKSGIYYFVTTLTRSKYVTSRGDSVYNKLSLYKFTVSGVSLSKEYEYHEEELPKFVSGVEHMEMNFAQCEFVDTNNDSLLEIIIVYRVAPELAKAFFLKVNFLILANNSLNKIRIENSFNSKIMEVNPQFYKLPIVTQNHVVNKVNFLSTSNILPKKWKKGIRLKETLIK